MIDHRYPLLVLLCILRVFVVIKKNPAGGGIIRWYDRTRLGLLCVLLLELIDTSGGIHQNVLTGEEGV